MNYLTGCLIMTSMLLLFGCTSLGQKASLINRGDEKEWVLKVMGTPDDQQFLGTAEAWQYCQTGAGFGYHDYRIIWFIDGKVVGLNSYKSSRPETSCMADLRPVVWQDAPHEIIELRNR